MKLTKTQIKDAINKMRATQQEKTALQKQCDEGNTNSLFAVYALRLRQKGNK